ncbi:YdeI/OmpD-associated family protein [Kribbella sp. CA-253562]|uniref:YdeI/OmpD-associated family protein n=1 Tax=Kribbella sp. CA-253562 TaxID=3239942 RepID=UPI003D94CEA2
METFEAVIQDAGGGGAYVEIPAEVLSALGGGARIPVQATFDGVPYRGSIVSMGGCQALGVLKGIRSRLSKSTGDTVSVTVTRDTAERTVEVPPDLAEALAGAGLRETFDRLSYSHRREHVNAVLDAKRPETRTRRIAKTLDLLRSS